MEFLIGELAPILIGIFSSLLTTLSEKLKVNKQNLLIIFIALFGILYSILQTLFPTMDIFVNQAGQIVLKGLIYSQAWYAMVGKDLKKENNS